VSLLAASSPIVDWGKLGQVVLYSLGSGVGVAVCFSLAILGATRFADARRGGGGGAGGAAVGYAILATLGLAATVGAVVIGIIVMTSKS
jgi:hypothetical protein